MKYFARVYDLTYSLRTFAVCVKSLEKIVGVLGDHAS